jgi:hypothetical protein
VNTRARTSTVTEHALVAREFSAEGLRDLYGDVDTSTRAWNAAVDELIALDVVLPRSQDALRTRGRTLVADRFNQ